MNKKLLSIGETADFLGVSIDTLRLWEKKNILLSFRPSSASKRYYKKDDIDQFLGQNKESQEVDLENLAKNWLFSKSPGPMPKEFYCQTSDAFSARLQHFSLELSRIPELQDIFSLLIAIVGEIGNNAYNHNLGNWADVPGLLFAYKLKKSQIVLADRGQGILATLQRVAPKLKTHQEALRTAFTKYISGRFPENRGNGLKFVKDIVMSNPIKLQFYSGNAKLEIGENAVELNIQATKQSFRGCLAIINY